MTEQPEISIPTIIADDDDGSGFLAIFETPLERKSFLKVYGVEVSESGHALDRGKLCLTCYSKYTDDEGNWMKLLVADFIGVTEWIGYPVLEGMLTRLLYRTEAEALADKKEVARNKGCYWPKGPMPEDEGYFHSKPVKSIRCRISLIPRGNEHLGDDNE